MRLVPVLVAAHLTALTLSVIVETLPHWPGRGFVAAAIVPYTKSLGLRQSWRMFADPVPFRTYVRLRHRLSGGARTRTVVEFAAPSHEFVRTIAGVVAVAELLRVKPGDGAHSGTAALSAAMKGIVAVHQREATRAVLLEGERIDATEVWFGAAPLPPPGTQAPPSPVRPIVERWTVEVPSAPAVPVGTLYSEPPLAWRLLMVLPTDGR